MLKSTPTAVKSLESTTCFLILKWLPSNQKPAFYLTFFPLPPTSEILLYGPICGDRKRIFFLWGDFFEGILTEALEIFHPGKDRSKLTGSEVATKEREATWATSQIFVSMKFEVQGEFFFFCQQGGWKCGWYSSELFKYFWLKLLPTPYFLCRHYFHLQQAFNICCTKNKIAE